MKLWIAAATTAATMALAPAMAQAQDADNVGAYVNLNAGIADASSADLKALQARLGYRFHPNFGVEGEFGVGVDSDTDTIGGVRVNQKLKHQAAAYLVGFLPVGPNTDLLARVGYGTAKIRVRAGAASLSDSEESVNFGVGVQHHFDGVNGIRADYTRFEFDGGPADANVWTIGYSRRF